MLTETKPIRNLGEFLDSEYWQMWDSSNRSPGSCGIILQDPGRYDRIIDAAECGAEGSTHAEVMGDWYECLNAMLLDGVISVGTHENIEAEIDSCWFWHERNGSIDDQIG